MAATKKKTTMSKLIRERKVRERRLDKEARKQLRKQAAAEGLTPATDERSMSEPDAANTPDQDRP